MEVELRPARYSDLAVLFRFQLNEEAVHMAAFMPKNFDDQDAYLKKYSKFLDDPEKNMQTILADRKIVGSIAKFELDGKNELTYWIDKVYWGRGIATAALKSFLAMEKARPIYARIAFDNVGSQKVLEKCGLLRIGSDKGYANARQAEIEEFIYKLD